jgi:hypothetical protein
MSTKIDFVTYLRATLVSAPTKLKSAQPPDLNTAIKLDRIARTAENISSGYWAKVELLYEPFAPKLQIANASVHHSEESDDYLLVRGDPVEIAHR